VAGRIDGITSTIHLSRERHVSQITAADGYTSNWCCGIYVAASNALALMNLSSG